VIVRGARPRHTAGVSRALPLLALLASLAACRGYNPANDPMKCERDPNCQRRSDKSQDCATQCVDNLECMKRCEMMRGHR
jgi:hypothetical protein